MLQTAVAKAVPVAHDKFVQIIGTCLILWSPITDMPELPFSEAKWENRGTKYNKCICTSNGALCKADNPWAPVIAHTVGSFSGVLIWFPRGTLECEVQVTLSRRDFRLPGPWPASPKEARKRGFMGKVTERESDFRDARMKPAPIPRLHGHLWEALKRTWPFSHAPPVPAAELQKAKTTTVTGSRPCQGRGKKSALGPRQYCVST